MRYIYTRLFMLSFGVFAVLNTELGIVGILPELALASHKTISQMGYLIGTFALTVTFIGPFFTLFILSRMERKKALLLAQCLLALNNTIFIFFPFYPILFLGRILGGLGHPLFFTLALSYPARTLPLEKKAIGSSIILSGVNVAFVVGFPIIALLTTHFSYKIGLSFSLAMNLLAFLGILFLIPKSSEQEGSQTSLHFSSFKDRSFLFTLPVITLMFTGVFLMYSYFSPYLREIWNLSSQSLRHAIILFGFFGLCGNILFGFIPTKRVIPIFIGSLILFMGIFSLLATAFSISIFVLVSLWGFFQSGTTLVGQIWLTLNRKAPPEAINSLLTSSSNLGITLGSILGGLFISHIGIYSLAWASISTLFLAILGIILEWMDSLASVKKDNLL